jgi:hypothetical protein
LRKTIKSNIRFEGKLNEEVPKGKNYIIKNVKGRDEIKPFVHIQIYFASLDAIATEYIFKFSI